MADFETTTDPNDCRVWYWGIVPIDRDDYPIIRGTSIHSFISEISDYSSVIYFHNLKFDSAFILDYILNQGYVHFDPGTNARTAPGTFNTLISGMGQFYKITVYWRSGGKTEFRDSLKKLPMSVKSIAKTFNLEETKGEIDYHAPRPRGHTPTLEEQAYLDNDLIIVAKALKSQIAEGATKLTVGADALHSFKGVCGPRFDLAFPVLSDTVDSSIRAAYRGGYTYADDRFSKRIVGPGRVYDVNSLYPSVMYDRVLPYGQPCYYDGLPEVDSEYPLFIASITFTAKLKPDHLPIIQLKASSAFISNVYLREIPEPVTLSLTNVDLALWQAHYDMDILSVNGSWRFHGTSGFFTDYIDHWMEIKASSTGGKRMLAKLMLNSLYGKFATNPDVTGKVPVLEDGVVHLRMGEEKRRDPVYTAMGVFITAYAREVTIRTCQHHYDVFAYCDTDSAHLLVDSDPSDMDIDPNRLGAWKHELTFEAAMFVRAKCYSERTSDGVYHTHIAGMPESIAETLTFDSFTDGAKFWGKLLPKRVPGGMVLQDTAFTLNM